MRDIKFRAWIKKEYDQCGGFMLYDPDKEATDYFMVSNGTGFAVVYDEEWLKEDSYEIMQFTGLHDKNGVEIYESDIVKGRNGDINLVKWVGDMLTLDYSSQGLSTHIGTLKEVLEIIGNIHQSPELLK